MEQPIKLPEEKDVEKIEGTSNKIELKQTTSDLNQSGINKSCDEIS